MKYGYREVRTLTAYDLRNLCIAEDWCTGATNEEYSKILDLARGKANITTDDIVEIATAIVEHSETALEGYTRCSGMGRSDFYLHIMYLIAEKCHTFFEEI